MCAPPAAGEKPERREHEDERADEGGNRVSGQAEHGLSPPNRQGKRPARFHRNAPPAEAGLLGQQPRNMVLVPRRHTAGRHECIDPIRRRRQQPPQFADVIRRNSDIDRLKSPTPDQRKQHGTVCIQDMLIRRGASGRSQFLAGGQHTDPQAPPDLHAVDPGRDQVTNGAGAKPLPRSHQPVPHPDVLSGQPGVEALPARTAKHQLPVLDQGAFIKDHGIRPVRQHGPGQHPHRVARSHRGTKRPTGGRASLHQAQPAAVARRQ